MEARPVPAPPPQPRAADPAPPPQRVASPTPPRRVQKAPARRAADRNRVRPAVAAAVGAFVVVAALIGIISLLNSGSSPSRTAASATTPWLGVQLEPLPIDRVIVTAVTPGSPADRAGIGSGDLIASLQGQQVSSPGDVYALLSRLHAGQRVAIQVDRGGTSLTMQATLGSRPSNSGP